MSVIRGKLFCYAEAYLFDKANPKCSKITRPIENYSGTCTICFRIRVQKHQTKQMAIWLNLC